jgi:uncharacterized protein (TIGR02186 family)
MRRILAALALAAAFAASPARADQLAAGLSTDAIQITSSFRGADVVIFGAVAGDARLGDLRQRDIVVVLRGPDAPIIVRRKDRVAGLWVNVQEVTISGLPGFHYLASTRPLDRLAPDATLDGLTLGASRLEAALTNGLTFTEAVAFQTAAIRVKTRARLYGENGHGVELLGPHLFRVRARLPAAVPPGNYRAEVFLFEKGVLVARQTAALPIRKAGLERRLADYAENEPLPYALATVALALVLGWAGFAAFRRS